MKHKPGVAIALIYDDRFLLQFRDDKEGILYPGRWCFFAGTLEEKETPRNCIHREMVEELCIQVTPISLARVSHSGGRKNLFYGFLDEQDMTEIRVREGAGYGFFSIAALESLDALGDVKGGLSGAVSYYFLRKRGLLQSLLDKRHAPFPLLRGK